MQDNKQRSKDLESVLAILTGLVVLGIVFSEKTDLANKFLLAAAGIGILAIFSTVFVKLLAKGWMKLAEVMGFVMSKVVLSSVFFLFLTPIAALYRLSTKNGMKKRPQNDSYFEDRMHTFNDKDFDNPW